MSVLGYFDVAGFWKKMLANIPFQMGSNGVSFPSRGEDIIAGHSQQNVGFQCGYHSFLKFKQ